MSDEEKPIDLRDKIAIEIFNGLMSSGKFNVDDVTGLLRDEGTAVRIYAQERTEQAVRGCYKIADIFRKVRLSSFE
jgi:hypothetical protein